MTVDFYQLAGTPPEQVIAILAEKILGADGRLIVIAEDQLFLARLDRMLWDRDPASFLPHAVAGGADDARQPILLSTSPDAPNLARNALIADGIWRDSLLSYDRSFFLFDTATLAGAREAWKQLAGRDGLERRYWPARTANGRRNAEGCRDSAARLGGLNSDLRQSQETARSWP